MTQRVWHFVRCNRFVAMIIWFALCGAGALREGSEFGWEVQIFYMARLRTRFVGDRCSAIMPYTSAEIPPAGAPSGFDSAAVFHFIVCFSMSVPLRSE